MQQIYAGTKQDLNLSSPLVRYESNVGGSSYRIINFYCLCNNNFIFPVPWFHALAEACNLVLSFSIANVMKSSGCEIPDWMLKLKKPGR